MSASPLKTVSREQIAALKLRDRIAVYATVMGKLDGDDELAVQFCASAPSAFADRSRVPVTIYVGVDDVAFVVPRELTVGDVVDWGGSSNAPHEIVAIDGPMAMVRFQNSAGGRTWTVRLLKDLRHAEVADAR